MIDENFLTEFLQNFDEDKHIRMMEVFIAAFQKHVGIAKAAVNDNDLSLLESSAHDVKSVSRTLGHENLADIAESIEDNLSEDNESKVLEVLPIYLPLLEQDLKILEEKLEKLR